MGNTYKVFNGPMPTTASQVAVTTSTAIKTMLQLKPAVPINVIEWGISFDGSAAAAGGICELLETGTVFATVTALAAADVFPQNDSNAPANSAGTSGTPLNLGTTHSGYTATAEGSITVVRQADVQIIQPTNQYVYQSPLGFNFKVPAGNCLRVRVKFAAAINAIAYITFEV